MEYQSYKTASPSIDFSAHWQRPVSLESLTSDYGVIGAQNRLDIITEAAESTLTSMKSHLELEKFSKYTSKILKNFSELVLIIPHELNSEKFSKILEEVRSVAQKYLNGIIPTDSFEILRLECLDFIENSPLPPDIEKKWTNYSEYLSLYSEYAPIALGYFADLEDLLADASFISKSYLSPFTNKYITSILWEGLSSIERNEIAKEVEKSVNLANATADTITRIFSHYSRLAKSTQIALVNQTCTLFKPQGRSNTSKIVSLLTQETSKNFSAYVAENCKMVKFPVEMADVSLFCNHIVLDDGNEFHKYFNQVSIFVKYIDDRVEQLRKRFLINCRNKIGLAEEFAKVLQFGKPYYTYTLSFDVTKPYDWEGITDWEDICERKIKGGTIDDSENSYSEAEELKYGITKAIKKAMASAASISADDCHSEQMKRLYNLHNNINFLKEYFPNDVNHFDLDKALDILSFVPEVIFKDIFQSRDHEDILSNLSILLKKEQIFLEVPQEISWEDAKNLLSKYIMKELDILYSLVRFIGSVFYVNMKALNFIKDTREQNFLTLTTPEGIDSINIVVEHVNKLNDNINSKLEKALNFHKKIIYRIQNLLDDYKKIRENAIGQTLPEECIPSQVDLNELNIRNANLKQKIHTYLDTYKKNKNICEELKDQAKEMEKMGKSSSTESSS